MTEKRYRAEYSNLTREELVKIENFIGNLNDYGSEIEKTSGEEYNA